MTFPRLTLCAAFATACAAPLPATIDRNLDGVSDVWSALHPTAGAPSADPDGDGASNLAESIAGTDPLSSASGFTAALDTDAAGNLSLRWREVAGKRYSVEASAELRTWLEFPCIQAPAGANLTAIVRPAGTSAGSAKYWRVVVADSDADGDGLNDWEEVQLETSPTETDTDHDGLPDAWEAAFGLDPTVTNASADPDADLFTNAQEFAAGTDPVVADRLAPFPAEATEFPGAGEIPFFWRADWYVDNWRGCRDRYWLNRTTDHGKAAVLGDSITQFWWTSADDFPFPSANRGIMGDFTRGILFRLQTDVLAGVVERRRRAGEVATGRETDDPDTP